MQARFRKLRLITCLCAELGVLAGLFWKFYDLGQNVLFYPQNTAIYPGCLFFTVGVFSTWLLSSSVSQFRVCVLSGSSAVMAVGLLFMVTAQPVDFVSKEVRVAAAERNVPREFFQEWLNERCSRLNSERLTCAIVLLCTLLLCAYRVAASRGAMPNALAGMRLTQDMPTQSGGLGTA
jgi:hypothetical protein